MTRRPAPAASPLLAVGAAAVLAAPAVAWAHPGDEASPPTAVNAFPRPWSPTAEEPEQARILFSAPVADVGGHVIELTDAAGRRVDHGRVRLAGPSELSVPVDAADPGLYVVRYTALLQGHQARGEYNFAYERPAEAAKRVSVAWLAPLAVPFTLAAAAVPVAAAGTVALRSRRRSGTAR